MGCCAGCGDKTQTGSRADSSTSNICVRCLTFWILVALISFGLLVHKHGAGGEVYF